MNNNDLLNADYPIPDPAWDYCQIWHHSQTAAGELNKHLKYLATVEDAKPETDAQIKSQLDSIGQRLNSARRLIDS
ncbi:MAG: hypothetical protein ACYT04_42550 [Nostoc sp.]